MKIPESNKKIVDGWTTYFTKVRYKIVITMFTVPKHILGSAQPTIIWKTWIQSKTKQETSTL
jgi:hypothetical protein